MLRFVAALTFLFLIIFNLGAQELPAFPGAEGFGKYTTGGRGGRVIYVTTLDDNNLPGSLRYAIEQSGPRIILFKVSGTIQLKSMLKITNGDLTIAGQTAPGDGITLRDYTLYVGAGNVIIRFLRFRLGDESQQENDPIWGREQQNIIIDHCSMSWSTDENASFYDNENFTLQWCIVAESLRNSIHNKGTHGYGGIWGGQKASFHHNLLAHNDSRNPRFCGSRYSNKAASELVDFRNNVIYNWGSNSVYAGEGGNYNMVNNYYKSGPATSSSVKTRILQPYADNGENNQQAGIFGTFYISGNTVSESETVTSDNWLGVSLHSTFTTFAPEIIKNDIKSSTEFQNGEVTTHSSEKAFEKVLVYSGASLKRDAVDLRIIHDAETGSAEITDGGNGSTNGLIDTQSAVGGWPVLLAENPPNDSDNDGMSDDWEIAHNLSRFDENDAKLTTVDGVYPNLEVYLNDLVDEIITGQNLEGMPTSSELVVKAETKPKIYFSKTDETLNINHFQNFTGIKIFSITGQLLFVDSVYDKTLKTKVDFLKNGMYIVVVSDEKNKVFSEKIIKY